MKTITKLIYAAFAAVTLAIGAVTAQGAVNDLFVSINGDGSNGAGSIFEYTPTGVQSLFASGLSAPRGMGFDRFGNLFVANTTFDEVTQTSEATIVKITPGGVQSTFAALTGNLFGEGVVFDHSGNLFVAAIDSTNPEGGPSTIYKLTPDGVQSTFGSTPGMAFALIFDSAGNLFAADSWVQTIYEFTPDGTRTIFVGPTAFDPFTGPNGLAFDRFGNLFASTLAATPAGSDTILKFTPNGVESTFATDLDWPRGLAFDRSGNLFVAERGAFAPPGDVLKFTPDGDGTVFAPDLDDPQFLAFQLLPPVRARPTPHPRPMPR
jgi:sugar lactone lactonase YvrE